MHRKRSKRKNRLIKLLIFVIGVLAILVTIDSQLRPIIQNMAQVQARAICTQIINEAITEVLADEKITYQQLVEIRQNSEGEVLAINTDIVELNRLKAQINIHVQTALTQTRNREILIPVGSLLGSDLLIGRGPPVKIKLSLANNVISNIEYAFESAGINQTLHQINLVLSANIYAIIPWYNTSTQVDTNFCLAETVIVGNVPDAYTHITEAEQNRLAEDIADYGAETPD